MPPGVAFFGATRGIVVNYSPDNAVEYDLEGNMLATLSKASETRIGRRNPQERPVGLAAV
jgi:hypothetical protein